MAKIAYKTETDDRTPDDVKDLIGRLADCALDEEFHRKLIARVIRKRLEGDYSVERVDLTEKFGAVYGPVVQNALEHFANISFIYGKAMAVSFVHMRVTMERKKMIAERRKVRNEKVIGAIMTWL